MRGPLAPAGTDLVQGAIVFSGTTVDELRANFREALAEHPRQA